MGIGGVRAILSVALDHVAIDKFSVRREDVAQLPELFVLYQNYPNPFNGQTRISFDLLEDAVVSLYITDATGRIHDKLVEHEYISSGIYNYTWDGEGRSTGIYFITLQAQIGQDPIVIFSRKMIYLK